MTSKQAGPGSQPGGSDQFPTTLWTVVLTAGKEEASGSSEALAVLCNAYWYPLYAFLRRQGQTAEDARDSVQSFIAHLLANHRLAGVHPGKGRFRSFLLAALRNFVSDERRKRLAQKRLGQAQLISLDAQGSEERYRIEPVERYDPEKLFERGWAMTVLERVLCRLKEEASRSGTLERFDRLRPFLLGDDPGESYAEIGQQLGMSEGAVKMAVLRLRQRGRTLLRAEIAETVASEDEIEDEVRHLFAVLTS